MAALRGQYRHIPNALHKPGVRWWEIRGLVKLNFFISVVFVGQAFNGFDDGLIGSFQAYPSWHRALGYPSSSAIGLLNAAAYIAGLLTAPVAGYVADRWGRRWCVRYSAIAGLVATAIGACAGIDDASGQYAFFIVSRIIFGSGLAFCVVISPILLQELPHPSQRVIIAGLFNTNYAVGNFIAAWLCFGCSYIKNDWSWRTVYIIQIIPALYLLLAIHFVPESPRWLMSKGREAEALDFLVKYHGDGNPKDELVLFEFGEMKETLQKEKDLRQDTWREIVSRPGNRHRLYIVLLIVSCQNLSGTAIIQYYYTHILKLVGITDTQQVTGLNAGLTFWVWLAAILGVYIVSRVKRRTLLLGAWSALIVVNVAFTVTAAEYTRTGSAAAGRANIALLWLYDGAFFIVCGPLFFSYQAECLSYSMRAKGMMLWGMVNKLISIFNAYVNSIALDEIGWKYYLVYTCILSIQLVGMYFLCVETSGLTLEEISAVFDGPATAPTVDAGPFEAGLHEKKGDTHLARAADGDTLEK
ncbi:General substrate transporter [Rhodotorula toruloides]|uniref:General substrate transporter n=1 Tax=Rhodotorula toruloides TaxID=5286 RepID=A0A2S9ZY87_RHOTO|nr:General substrate transporter [Rhodotorula toruloides]